MLWKSDKIPFSTVLFTFPSSADSARCQTSVSPGTDPLSRQELPMSSRSLKSFMGKFNREEVQKRKHSKEDIQHVEHVPVQQADPPDPWQHASVVDSKLGFGRGSAGSAGSALCFSNLKRGTVRMSRLTACPLCRKLHFLVPQWDNPRGAKQRPGLCRTACEMIAFREGFAEQIHQRMSSRPELGKHPRMHWSTRIDLTTLVRTLQLFPKMRRCAWWKSSFRFDAKGLYTPEQVHMIPRHSRLIHLYTVWNVKLLKSLWTRHGAKHGHTRRNPTLQTLQELACGPTDQRMRSGTLSFSNVERPDRPESARATNKERETWWRQQSFVVGPWHSKYYCNCWRPMEITRKDDGIIEFGKPTAKLAQLSGAVAEQQWQRKREETQQCEAW